MWNLNIWEKRYKAEADGRVDDTFARVAKALADTKEEEAEFFEVMASKRFLPAGRILRCAGVTGYMVNCFYVPLDDSLEGIFRALQISMTAQSCGGGVGYNFSPLREFGSRTSKGGTATGPCSFIDIFDQASAVISGVSERKAANIAVLNVKHPDVREFITAKLRNAEGARRWTRFNVSVDLTPEEAKGEVWDMIVGGMYDCGDPGLVNLDECRKSDPSIAGVNPCGEQPLPPYGSCCLGSVVLPEHVEGGRLNERLLAKTAQVGSRLLYRVITKGKFPHPLFQKRAMKEKRIGTGITGYAHALIKMGVLYSKSGDAVRNVLTVMREAIRAVNGESKTVMTIAPTGTTSLMAKVSSGIEPIFSVQTVHVDNTGEHTENDPLWGQYPAGLFETAHSISPRDHLAVQIAAQGLVDAGVSKTINVPSDYPKGDLSSLLVEGLCHGIKGVTVYRDGSLPAQVMNRRTAEVYEVNTPQGNTHIILGVENDKPKAVYILLHKPGGDTFALSSALGRALSIGFQGGVRVDHVASSLIDIGSTGVTRGEIKCTYGELRLPSGKKVSIQSVPDAVGKLLSIRFGSTPPAALRSANLCPECGRLMNQQEGCETCASCGFTRC